jgi:hypothetical protein
MVTADACINSLVETGEVQPVMVFGRSELKRAIDGSSVGEHVACVAQSMPHGFTTKVSDFGVLRELDLKGYATPRHYPYLGHLAPEVLLKGRMSRVGSLSASEAGVSLTCMAHGTSTIHACLGMLQKHICSGKVSC